MKHLAAYLLLVSGGNDAPTAEDVTALLAEVGVEADNDRLQTLIDSLAGKDLAEVIAEGTEKLYKGGMGGGGGGGGGGGAAPSASAEAAPVAAAKPKEEEVDALEGGMDMFGGGGKDY